MHRFALHLPLALAAGCGGSDLADADPAASAPTWHQDVAPMVMGRCVSCHQEGEVAPFPLDSFDAAAPLADVIASAVEARTMPPWGAEAGHRSYLDDPSLSEADIATIRAWAEAGAPEGDPSSPADPWPAVGSSIDAFDLTLRSEQVYTVDGDPDDYRCFVIPWPETAETKWVTGFTADVDNRNVVHHVAAFLFRPDNIMGESVFERLQAWEDRDEAPGYRCFGGPAGDTTTQVPAQQLAQWVPGMGDLPFPEGSGIEVPPGSYVVLQVHYFDPGTGEQRDQTGLSLQLADEVRTPAAFAPWLNGSWAIGNMEIPAGEANVEHSVEGDPRSFFEILVGGLDLSQGFDIHSALFHMHKLGTRGELELVHADGSSEIIVVVDPWDFDWQRVYRLAEPARFRDGDKLRLRCLFDNSAENPETGGNPVDVTWGEGTEDEMCVGNLFVTVPEG